MQSGKRVYDAVLVYSSDSQIITSDVTFDEMAELN